ncbi:TetR family transcriptional regulator [Rhodobacter maris]|uniref:TetR family transcriptional regulator n=1 Tax=Rhodobacter maris TaxID=446682 RepID=UPI001C3EB297|nr:TetR family transcriptional regulator [Rhodobacter maris]
MRRSKAEAEQTREKILDAAARLFCVRGIAQTTLEQIAREAGATRGAFYWYFKDKTDVLNAIYERYKPPPLDQIEAAAAAGPIEDPFGIMAATGLEFLAMVENDPIQQRLHLILISGQPGDETAPWRERHNGHVYGVLVQLMTQARTAGQLAPDLTPEQAAVSQMAMINGLIGEWHRSGQAFGLAAAGEKLLPRFLVALRCRAS